MNYRSASCLDPMHGAEVAETNGKDLRLAADGQWSIANQEDDGTPQSDQPQSRENLVPQCDMCLRRMGTAD